MREFFTKDIGWKLLSLLLAITIYVIVKGTSKDRGPNDALGQGEHGARVAVVQHGQRGAVAAGHGVHERGVIQGALGQPPATVPRPPEFRQRRSCATCTGTPPCRA